MKRDDLARHPPRLDEQHLTRCDAVQDEDELEDVLLNGDFVGRELSLVTLRQCQIDAAVFTAARLVRATFVDCVVSNGDWSGAVFEECRFERVEFRGNRMSGLQAQGSAFRDVGMLDCKLDGANFRMTSWERGELRDCNLADADLYAAKFPGGRIQGCDLSDVELSKCDLSGTRLHRSTLDGVRGGESLRGAVIGGDQLIPVALAVFGSMAIRVEDDE